MRVGEVFYGRDISYEIIEWESYTKCTIKFSNGFIKKNIAYNSLSKGNISTPFCKTVFNIGYLGIGDYNPKNHN